MSTDRSEDIARALAVPDPRLADSDALWTSQTTWPEQSPRPGRPVDQGDSSLVLSAYGARETEDVLELKTTKAGSIDPLTGAGFAWREQGGINRLRNKPTVTIKLARRWPYSSQIKSVHRKVIG